MRFLRITGAKSITARYIEGCADRGVGADCSGDALLIQDIYYDNGFKYLSTEQLLPEYDVYRIGGLGSSYKSMSMGLVYYYGILHKKRFLDPVCLSSGGYSKVMQHLCFDHFAYPTLKTMFFCPEKKTKNRIMDIICKKYVFPVIVKNPTLDRGEGVDKIDSKEELFTYIETCIAEMKGKGFLVQEFYPADGDYRSLVMGEKVLGTFRRSNPSGFKHNIAQGGEGSPVDIPKDMQKLFVRATKSVGLDIGGVDFFRDGQGTPVFIEINRMPQYAGFERITGINFLSALRDYLA